MSYFELRILISPCHVWPKFEFTPKLGGQTGVFTYFCCRIFILFATWHPRSWFKAVCDQKNLILCRYRTRITLNNRVMWTVSDLSLPVSIASRCPPGPLEAECPVIPPLTIHQFIPLSIHPYPCMNACTDIVYRCPCFPLCYGWRVGIVHPKCHC